MQEIGKTTLCLVLLIFFVSLVGLLTVPYTGYNHTQYTCKWGTERATPYSIGEGQILRRYKRLYTSYTVDSFADGTY
jgi:hypothetical protein